VSGPGHLAEPGRLIRVEWGELQARCSHPDRVLFTQGTEHHSAGLVINRVAYRFAVVLDRGEVPVDRRHNVTYVDRTWHLDRSNSWSLRRDDNGDPGTDAAYSIVRQQLMPKLAEWLAGETAAELLAAGAGYWVYALCGAADELTATLQAAMDRVADLRARALGGELLSDDEERYVRCLRVETPR
jgi:hypothetical protein